MIRMLRTTSTPHGTAAIFAVVLAAVASVATLLAQSTPGVISGPVGPSCGCGPGGRGV